MQKTKTLNTLILGVSLILGLSSLGLILGGAALRVKAFERTVVVKGLSEREYPADVVIWPIRFTEAANDLAVLYEALDASAAKIAGFLKQNGVAEKDISVSPPDVTDKWAERYGSGQRPQFRYSATQTVTVYSTQVETVRGIMSRLSELGKRGIAFTGTGYGDQAEYLFTRLNEVKPAMIEEATRKAREVAEKFAADSKSRLGKIRKARQGQFSIAPRDQNNPHIKRVRVVSTVEYYLSD